MQFSVGCDIEEVVHFSNKSPDDSFLRKIFTDNELEYCFSKKIPAQHLAARYCAKEAVVKALSAFGVDKLLYKNIEIINEPNGQPFVVLKDFPDFTVKVSLSHTANNAMAYVLAIK